MSEYLSILLEPIASENTKSMEVNSTDGMLAEIVKMNEENSSLQEGTPQPLTGTEVANKSKANHMNIRDENGSQQEVLQEENIPGDSDTITTNTGGEYVADLQPLAGAGVGNNSQTKPINDIVPLGWKDHEQDQVAFLIQENSDEIKTLHIDTERYTRPEEDMSRSIFESKTKMIRRKMMEARKKRSQKKMNDVQEKE